MISAQPGQPSTGLKHILISARNKRLSILIALFTVIFTLFQPFSFSESGPVAHAATTTFTPPPNGFTWKMADRFGTIGLGGLVDFHWSEQYHVYYAGYPTPNNFTVTFDGCQNATDETNNYTSLLYTWSITGVGGFSGNYTQGLCRSDIGLPAQGSYHVKLIINNPDGSYYLGKNPFAEQDIVVKDFLIAAIGDSYGSGEGSPDINASPIVWPFNTNPVWEDTRCHRSANAPSAKAAMAIEQADPHTSVTYISFACSGAPINRNYNDGLGPTEDAYDPGDSNQRLGTGVLGDYRGIDPSMVSSTDYLPSQIDQLKAAIGNRQIDALIVSAGGNDMAFAPLAKDCVLYSDCPNAPVYDANSNGVKNPLSIVFNEDLKLMPGRYAALNTALSALNIKKVYITEYPDATKNDDGTLCPSILSDAFPGLSIDSNEVQWVSNVVIPGINSQVRAAAQTYGWDYITKIAQDFSGHGYCAQNNWINTSTQSWAIENGDKGRVHPNTAGYSAIANRLIEHLMPNLLPVPLSDGMLIKGSDANIYVYYKGPRFFIPNPTVASNSGYNLNNVTTLYDIQLNSIPLAPDGTLVQAAGDTNIWAIYKHTRFLIPNSQVFTASGYDPSKVITLPVAMFNTFNAAGDNTLVQAAGDTSYWVIYNNVRFLIPNSTVFNAAGYKLYNVAVLPSALFSSISNNTDNTILRNPDDGSLWIMQGGQRLPYSGTSTNIHTMPSAMLNSIVAVVPTPGKPALIVALKINPSQALVNSSVTASFTIQNVGGQALTLTNLVTTVQDSAGGSHNFPAVTNITLQPGATYVYSQSQVFTVDDFYTAWPVISYNNTTTTLSSTGTNFAITVPTCSKYSC
ncbi:MAG TPA: hypothetical protein VH186_20495 [Chloroflexia bacterium]|nr:hypothetical protein [Chloroflexia bacterium]